ncbi:MAG: hypothetical protein WD355_00125 [Balneolaceae bacterium]
MKRTFPILLFAAVLIWILPNRSEGQALELIGGNTLNGAITGAALGTATMSLNHSQDFKYLRIGLGAGILGGTAIAVYDITTLPNGQQFYISGIMNDGYNSSIIILLDTIYGAATGAVLGAGVSLIAERPVLEGVQYGTSIGAWGGFGIGLLDAFVIADRNRDLMALSDYLNRNTLLKVDTGENSQVGLIQPTTLIQKEIRSGDLRAEFQPALQIFSYRIDF